MLYLICRKKRTKTKGFSMRETRIAQASIFENYSKHEFGNRLRSLSDLLDQHVEVLDIIGEDINNKSVTHVGRNGLTLENIFRCLLLKQYLQVSYKQLSFHLSDSSTYRAFTRLPAHLAPSKSALQATIRCIKPETLQLVHNLMSSTWYKNGHLSLDKIRIDSTVVLSDITPPSDSQLLNDGVRVLSRNLAKLRDITGYKLRFTDQRKKSKSLAFKIFNAKVALKEALYPDLLNLVAIVIKQVDRGLLQAKACSVVSNSLQKWIDDVDRFRDLTLKVVDQTQRRIFCDEKVPASEKIVSIFEPHTDVIVKGFREVQYGHKVNLSTEGNGFITCFSIEDGNPSDKDLFMPVLDFHQKNFDKLPGAVVCDGGYASKENVTKGRNLGIKHVVFHKRVGISYHAMGVKIKTFKKLRNFRAGVEGNISELKRAFGVGKARWKGHDGFKAFVWSSVISYNLMRLARLESG